MNNRDSPLFWSFPCGTWFATRVRLSVYFPLLFLVICLQLRNFSLGMTFGVVLMLSVVAHEFGHVLAARATGGAGREILIWPLGGLAFVQPADTLRSQILTTAAGPMVNIALCLIMLPATWNSGHWAAAINPLELPRVELAANPLGSILVLTFCANWILTLVNLIPVYPLDGGRLLQTLLATRLGGEVGNGIYLKVGFGVALLGMFAGLIIDSAWLVFIGAAVMAMNFQEMFQMHTGDSYDDSFMGYDFSQGYTSLERADESAGPRRPGPMKRWLQKRREERERRIQLRDSEDEQKLDELLEKVHTDGIDSLTDAERRQLKRASERARERGKQD